MLFKGSVGNARKVKWEKDPPKLALRHHHRSLDTRFPRQGHSHGLAQVTRGR